jgi:hypothetical protein
MSLATTHTAADRDVEAPEDGLSGDFLLELTDRLNRLQIPSAVRAGWRQGDRNHLVDLRGRSSVGMKTVVRTCFPAGRFGVDLGSSLGKGSRLPLLGPVGLLELAKDLRELTFEVGDASFEFRDLAVAWVGCFPAVSHLDLRVSPEIQHRRRRKGSSYITG